MLAGIPLVKSDFPPWRDICEGNASGICFDPLAGGMFAIAIDRLAGNSDEDRRVSENGRKAVPDRYNWRVEEQRLLACHEAVASGERVYRAGLAPVASLANGI